MRGREPFLCAALFLLTACVACGGAQSTPEGAVQGFLDALAERDTARFEASFTDGTQALVAEIESLSMATRGEQGAFTIEEWCRAFCGGTVEGSTLHGDSATVQVRVGQIVEQVPVVRTGDEWRLHFTSRLDEAAGFLRVAAAASEAAAEAASPGDTSVPVDRSGVDSVPADTAAP